MSAGRERPTQIVVSGLMTLAFLLGCWGALRPWVAHRAGRVAPLDRGALRALSIDSGNDRYRAAVATLYHYGLPLRDYPAALTYYHATLRSNPLDSASWLHLGKLYQKLDRPGEADRALRLAVQLAPSDPTILWETTVAYLEAGQIPEARRALGRFMSAARDDYDRAKGNDLARRLGPP